MNRPRIPLVLAWILLGLALVPAVRWLTGPNDGPGGPQEEIAGNRATKPIREADQVERPAGRMKARNWLERVNEGGPKLTREQIESYLIENRRSAESLLAVYLLTDRDSTYLAEALERFPGDPRVLQLAAEVEFDPEKRLPLLERFMAHAPDNALADYLAVAELLKLGRTDEALVIFDSAGEKKWSDSTMELIQAKDEALISAGHPAAEQRLVTGYNHGATSLMQMRRTMDEVAKVMEERIAAGDHGTAEHLRQSTRTMAGQIRAASHSVVHDLVANHIEARTYKDLGTPEAEAEIAAIRERGRVLSRQATAASNVLESGVVPESDLGNYFTRMKVFGEAEANEWLLERFATSPP